jgi:hypothetical protein
VQSTEAAIEAALSPAARIGAAWATSETAAQEKAVITRIWVRGRGRPSIGLIGMPTYFIWGTLIDGSPVAGMDQNEFPFRFSAVNMKLIAAGSAGL